MKNNHYVLRNFNPRLDADISSGKNSAQLNIWINYAPKSIGQMQVIFSRKCKDETEALEIMSGFGHGFEYTGAHWEQV